MVKLISSLITLKILFNIFLERFTFMKCFSLVFIQPFDCVGVKGTWVSTYTSIFQLLYNCAELSRKQQFYITSIFRHKQMNS